jgi:Sjoegren syndrome nuclear autoantigen 1
MMKNICGCWSCSEIMTALSQVDLGIEELREKKDKIKKVIQLEQEEKVNIQRELAVLAKRLAVIDESLSKKYAYVEEYDKTIQDVESAYCKV